MVGKLAVSFCERRAGQASYCLDLWSYPDETYNLVFAGGVNDLVEDFAFPCAIYQLAGVLDRKSMHIETEQGSVTVERCGENVCAHFTSKDAQTSFRQCIPMEDYRQALEAMDGRVVDYVA